MKFTYNLMALLKLIGLFGKKMVGSNPFQSRRTRRRRNVEANAKNLAKSTKGAEKASARGHNGTNEETPRMICRIQVAFAISSSCMHLAPARLTFPTVVVPIFTSLPVALAIEQQHHMYLHQI